MAKEKNCPNMAKLGIVGIALAVFMVVLLFSALILKKFTIVFLIFFQIIVIGAMGVAALK